MVVKILDQKENEFEAQIVTASKNDLETIKNWNFDWVELYSSKAQFYKLVYKSKINGLIKIKWENPEHFILDNIELAPKNVGTKGEIKNAAELLFAYCALLSFNLNKGPYKGFLSFKSKGSLIKHYSKKYKAELVFREMMIISPSNCKLLIKNHLKLEI